MSESESHWRNLAAPIIRRVLAESSGIAELAIRAALREAYPFGVRKYHPYKIWCDEIQRQRGLKPKLGARINFPPDPSQGDLFAEGGPH